MGKLSSLCLIVALSCITVAVAKHCYYCDFTNMGSCVSTTMYCGEEEDCYYGQGTVTGLTHIINRGCVEAIRCGREQPISYMGVTYSFKTYCCQGSLCNAGPKKALPSFIAIMAGLSLILLLSWML